MAYDYSSESKLLELPNPYRLQNRLLWLCAVLLVAGGILALWWAREAMQPNSLGRVAAPLLAGLGLLAAGLTCGATAATRLRFFFGRGRPEPLAPDLQPRVSGNSPAADVVKDTLRQGGLTYPEPKGAVENMLYHAAPRLITAPLEVQSLAKLYMFNLAAVTATLLSFVFSWAVFGTPATRPWIGLLYFAFGVYFLAKPVLSQGRARVNTASLVGLIAAAILAPVLIGLLVPHLPAAERFSLNVQTFVMLGTALVACGLAMVAVLAQVDEAPQTRVSVEQTRLSMNAPPASLMDELERTLQARWTDCIPNRRYTRLDPVTRADTPSGSFAGELLEETQPVPLAGTQAPAFGAALGDRRHRPLLLIDLYGVLLVVLAVVFSLVFVRNFDPTAAWSDNRISLAGTAAILAFVAWFCFKVSARLWGRFNFESTLVWVELMGTYQTSRIGTGNQFSSRMNTQNDVVRTEAMTLRVWRARIESVAFGKDAARQLTAMFATEKEAQSLTEHLVQFARGQSVLVAPTSSEDQVRIAALNAGERHLDGPSDGASTAQLHHELRAQATLASAEPRRHCTQCGAEAPAQAKFCGSCGAALPAPASP